MDNKKEHWENVYRTKTPEEVSWTQKVPTASLNFIEACNPKATAKIIDIGGGDSLLVDHLLDKGFEDITVLDISVHAIDRAKKRLGNRAENVTWIVSDILDFDPSETYDIWHDRATFHFLTTPEAIAYYKTLCSNAINQQLILGTFSENGPLKCSGLPITQYSEKSMVATFKDDFNLSHCTTENHTTPFNTTQHFLFCSFKKK